MRICSPQLGLAPKSILGGEVFDREILKGLASKGVKIDIILPKNKPYDKNITNFHVSHLFIKSFPAIFGNVVYLPSLLSINRKIKINILRLHQPQYFVLSAYMLKIINPGIKIVATYHKFDESSFGILSKLTNNFWDHIICDSKKVKERLLKTYEVKSSKISIVHNGVPNYLKPNPKDINLVKKLNLTGKIVLLFMGIFDRRKNPIFLLEVLKNINNQNVVILYWGNGLLKNDIHKYAQKWGLTKQIRIIDPVYGPEKNNIHNLADIFVHPSLDEGFALAPLESMACAKPVVISDNYSSSETVTDGENGFLAEINNVIDWQRKITNLISNSPLRQKMGDKSRKKVLKEFQWEMAADVHYKIFKTLSS